MEERRKDIPTGLGLEVGALSSHGFEVRRGGEGLLFVLATDGLDLELEEVAVSVIAYW